MEILRRLKMECPLCGEEHEVEVRVRNAKTIIKDIEVEYEETYYFCENSKEEENEFETGKMSNMNLLNARNSYRRKNNLLTSDEIVAIREKYGLTQVELARLLGWGEATISRYESKAIQDEAYDNMLRIISENPAKTLEFFCKNRDKFSEEKQQVIEERIEKEIEAHGKEYLGRQLLLSEYAKYRKKIKDGVQAYIDIDKVEYIISFYAQNIENLYKTKLMNLLWYTDSLNYQKCGKTMTGLVYQKGKNGAVPIGHMNLLNLDGIRVEEITEGETTKYRFLFNEELGTFPLDDKEKETVDEVIRKFMNVSTQEIIDYVNFEVGESRQDISKFI